jgi:hypothetical protein
LFESSQRTTPSAKGPALRQNVVVANGLRVFRCANRDSALLPTTIDYQDRLTGLVNRPLPVSFVCRVSFYEDFMAPELA